MGIHLEPSTAFHAPHAAFHAPHAAFHGLPSGTTLLSIGWRDWPNDYYKKAAEAARVRFVGVTAARVQHNPKHSEVAAVEAGKHAYVRKGSDQHQKMLAKWADVEAPMGPFLSALPHNSHKLPGWAPGTPAARPNARQRWDSKRKNGF